METTKSFRHSILLNDWAVSIDLTDAYLHNLIHRQSRKYLQFTFDNQVFQFSALPFVDFHQADGRYRRSPSTLPLTLSLPRRLAHKRSSTSQNTLSDNILSSNYASSSVHSKSKIKYLTPSQKFTFIDMESLTHHNTVRVP